MIGGATTSRVHTAVKIAPNYEGPVIYVPDASRSVGVATNLMSTQRDAYLAELAGNTRTCAAATPTARPRRWCRWPRRAARPQIDWDAYTPPRPSSSAAAPSRATTWPRSRSTWTGARSSRPGACSGRSRHPGRQGRGRAGAQGLCRRLAMMKRIVEGRWLTANGVVGFYPANSVNDEDIEIYKDETRSEVLFTYRNLRQQGAKREGVSNKSLSDFIAPKSSGKLDYGHVRRDRRPGHREEGSRVRTRPGRLFQHHAQVAGRPPGRGLRRMPARARAPGPVGLRARRGPVQRRHDRREVRGHPPAPGYPPARNTSSRPTCSACWTARTSA